MVAGADGALVIETPWGSRAAAEVAGASGLAEGADIALWMKGQAADLEHGDVSQLAVCGRCTQVSQPSSESPHWFGTDFLGRDLATRMFKGGQISLMVGLLAAVVSATIGILYGAIAGYARRPRRRRLDALRRHHLLAALHVPRDHPGDDASASSSVLIFVALGAVGWLTTARIVRGQVLTLKEREFVLAATRLGARGGAHRAPPPDPAHARADHRLLHADRPDDDAQEAFLSFLGLGVQPPQRQPGLRSSTTAPTR